jgi:hypothetical protein
MSKLTKMPTFGPPPDCIRDSFRDYLIHRSGAINLGLGHTEEIKRFKFYLDTLENFVSQQESEEIASLESDAARLTEAERSEFLSCYYPIHWDEIFRTNLRSSFVVSLMSLIETQLAEVSRNVAVIAQTPIQVSDLKGSFLERTRLFLEKFGLFCQPTTEVWMKVSQIYDVRNIFVHHAGFLPAYNYEKRIRQFIQASQLLSETNGWLILKSEFCVYTLTVAQAFLDAIASSVSALCDRVQNSEGPSN